MEEEAEQDEDTQEKSLLDQGRLDMLRSLQRPDRPNFLKKIIVLYQQTFPALLHTIRDAVSSGDSVNLQEAAHSLKTASANLGAVVLAAICKELEDIGHHEKLEAAKDLLDKLEESSRRLLMRFWWNWRKYLMNNNKGVRGQPVVLVVDDDMAKRLLIIETLLENNLAVEEAEDGVEALEVSQRIFPCTHGFPLQPLNFLAASSMG